MREDKGLDDEDGDVWEPDAVAPVGPDVLSGGDAGAAAAAVPSSEVADEGAGPPKASLELVELDLNGPIETVSESSDGAVEHSLTEFTSRETEAGLESGSATLDRGVVSESVPVPPDAMFYGPHGEFALAVAEATEAYAPAVLLSTMAAWGALMGARFTVEIGDAAHGPNMFVVLVGQSAESRKGTAIRPVGKAFDSGKLGGISGPLPVARGFNSHKGLLNYFMPEVSKDEDGTERSDWGDPRLWWVEDEFTKVLNASQAKGAAGQMGPTIRELWDGNSIENRISGETIVIPADRHHVSMVGAITMIELQDRMPDTDFFGGTGNRMLWVPVPTVSEDRWKLDGANTPRSVIGRYVDYMADARGRLPIGSHAGMEILEQPGGPAWIDFNGALRRKLVKMPERSKERLLHGRAPAYVARMALNFALADGMGRFEDRHVEAAVATWEWLASGMSWMFGGSTGDHQYDYYLAGIPEPGESPMSARKQKELFGNKYFELRARAISEGRAITMVGTNSGRPVKGIVSTRRRK